MTSLVTYSMTKNLQSSSNKEIKEVLASQGILKSHLEPDTWSDDLTQLMNECVSTVKVGLELMESKFLWALASREYDTPSRFVAEFGWGRACYQMIVSGLDDDNIEQYLKWLDGAANAYINIAKVKLSELMELIDNCTSNRNFNLKYNSHLYDALKEDLTNSVPTLMSYKDEVKHCIAMQDLKIKALELDKGELHYNFLDTMTPLGNLCHKFEQRYIAIVSSQKLLDKDLFGSWSPDASTLRLDWDERNAAYVKYQTTSPMLDFYQEAVKGGSPIALSNIMFGGDRANLSIYVVFKEYIDSLTTKLDETFWYVNKDFITKQVAAAKASWDVAKSENKLGRAELAGISRGEATAMSLAAGVLTASALGAVVTSGVSLLGGLLALGVYMAKSKSSKSDFDTPVTAETECVKQMYNELKADIRSSKSNMMRALQTLRPYPVHNISQSFGQSLSETQSNLSFISSNSTSTEVPKQNKLDSIVNNLRPLIQKAEVDHTGLIQLYLDNKVQQQESTVSSKPQLQQPGTNLQTLQKNPNFNLDDHVVENWHDLPKGFVRYDVSGHGANCLIHAVMHGLTAVHERNQDIQDYAALIRNALLDSEAKKEIGRNGYLTMDNNKTVELIRDWIKRDFDVDLGVTLLHPLKDKKAYLTAAFSPDFNSKLTNIAVMQLPKQNEEGHYHGVIQTKE